MKKRRVWKIREKSQTKSIDEISIIKKKRKINAVVCYSRGVTSASLKKFTIHKNLSGNKFELMYIKNQSVFAIL